MHRNIHVAGVDPGLVHTGVVSMILYPDHREIYIGSNAIDGPDEKAADLWLSGTHRAGAAPVRVFVEGYKPRSHFGQDQRMVEAVQRFRSELKATVLLNYGVKKVVKQPLMELLHLWKFHLVTHHQDLRSAARIMLLGMLKDEAMNRVLTTVVKDHLNGSAWDVHS